MKEEVSIRLISKESDLPDIASRNFFHSVEFFRILEATPMQEPRMAIAMDERGKVVAHMLTIVTYHKSLLPPALYSHGRVYGEGEYDEGIEREEMFRRFLDVVTESFKHRMCLYIEFSHLGSKMFGYESFRSKGYFPIQWQEIHNSLHSVAPIERLPQKILDRISEARQHGATTEVAVPGSKDVRQAIKLLKWHFKFKARRSIPSVDMFQQLSTLDKCKMFVTKYRKHVIGTCICIYTNGNAYMWHLASLRKSYMPLHPTTLTVWAALSDAYAEGMRHMYFLDAGLPFKHSPMRDFILSFGGKPVTKYRWFITPLPWLNSIVNWIYNE